MNTPRLAVTTSAATDVASITRARALAKRLGLPFETRRHRRAVGPLLEQYEAVLIVGADGVTLRDRDTAAKFHPGMAQLRLKRLDAGVMDDAFLRVSGLREGEHVLDCTLGLGQDAMVAARAVGPGGRVVGLEKSLPLFAFVSEGLARFEPGPGACRVECVHADAAEYLQGAGDRSFDVVVFDPMFEKPQGSQPAFELVRRYADHTPLLPQVLERARRVARRVVVVKGARYSHDHSRLGLQPVVLSRFAEVVWARVDAAT